MISGNHSFSLNVRRISCFESKLRQYSYTRQPIPDVVKKICLNECKIPSKLPYLALMSISGGVDSMAMLHIMKSVQRNHFPSLALEVIHFNHKKREQSEEEEKFVRQWCENYEIPCHVFTLDKTEHFSHSGFQEYARNWRRSTSKVTLQNRLLEHGIERGGIFQAHHLDDQLETILLKLVRGSYISNLSPMMPQSLQFIRPLLTVRKNELVDYMVTNNYTWYDDASNQERDYKRNIIRLDLLPLMESLCGSKNSLEKRLLGLANQSQSLKDYMNLELATFLKQFDCCIYYHDAPPARCKLTTTFQELSPNNIVMFEFSSQQLQSVHPFLQSELIVRICQSLMKESIDFATAQEIITLFNSPLEHGKDTRIVKIAKYWEVVVLSSHHISFRRCEELDATANTNLVNPMKNVENTTEFQGCFWHYPSNIIPSFDINDIWSVKSSLGNLESSSSSSTEHVLSWNSMEMPPGSRFFIRHPQDGDRIFHPLKKKPMKLTDYFRELKILLHHRSKTLVIEREYKNVKEILRIIPPCEYLDSLVEASWISSPQSLGYNIHLSYSRDPCNTTENNDALKDSEKNQLLPPMGAHKIFVRIPKVY